LWGHLAFGRAMLAARHLAFHDPYSYSAPGHLWINHEWLSESMMAAIYNLGGVVGLNLMKFGCCAAIMVSLASGLAETDAPMPLQLAIVLAAAIAIAPQMQYRPQLFSFVLMAVLLAILTRYIFRRGARLWLTIPMFALWANLHGGFIVGLATLGTFSAVVLMQDLRTGHDSREGLKLFGIFIAATLATLATPYGIDIWRAVAHALMNPRTRAIIDDWRPLPNALVAMWQRNHAGAIPMIVALAMFVSLGVTFLMRPVSDDLPMVAIAGLMIIGTLLAMRNLPLAVIATVIPLAHYFSHAEKAEPVPRSRIVPAVAAIALLFGSGLFSPVLRAGSAKPTGAIAFIQAHHLNGNVLTDFAWGEYVIWNLPASKVFIDGRYDTVYPSAVIDDYLAFDSGATGAERVLRKYPHDFILLGPNNHAALAVTEAAPKWKRIYRDRNCVLFARADLAAARIVSVEVPAQFTPASNFPQMPRWYCANSMVVKKVR
jgi:hypothetical protein